jgi:hypothetical protein
VTGRVLVTGARAAAALDIARDFGRAGYEVHMADCAPARISRWSRAVDRFHRYPSPVRDPTGFAERMLALAEGLGPALIVPTCEEVYHLARLAPALGAALLQPPLATLRRLHDKGRFAASCAELGLPIPETHLLADRGDLARFAARPDGWVLKARFSRFGGGTLVAPDAGALAAIDLRPDRPWIAQRRIVGREISFYAVARQGRLTAFAAYGANWRLDGGASISFDPVEAPLAETIRDIAGRLADAHHLTGQFACDLIVDQADQPWLLECNPRATSGVHLLARDGLLAAAMLGDSDRLLVPAGGSFHLLPALLSYGLGQAVRRGRLAQWRAQLRAGSDVAGQKGDRRPMIGAVIDGLGYMIAGAIAGIGATAATTADIEWNGDDQE